MWGKYFYEDFYKSFFMEASSDNPTPAGSKLQDLPHMHPVPHFPASNSPTASRLQNSANLRELGGSSPDLTSAFFPATYMLKSSHYKKIPLYCSHELLHFFKT